MKLVTLLGSIIALWCLLGAVVLGPGILAYPAAWCAVVAIMYGIHKFLGLGKDDLGTFSRTNSDSPDQRAPTDLPHNHPTAMAR